MFPQQPCPHRPIPKCCRQMLGKFHIDSILVDIVCREMLRKFNIASISLLHRQYRSISPAIQTNVRKIRYRFDIASRPAISVDIANNLDKCLENSISLQYRFQTGNIGRYRQQFRQMLGKFDIPSRLAQTGDIESISILYRRYRKKGDIESDFGPGHDWWNLTN